MENEKNQQRSSSAKFEGGISMGVIDDSQKRTEERIKRFKSSVIQKGKGVGGTRFAGHHDESYYFNLAGKKGSAEADIIINDNYSGDGCVGYELIDHVSISKEKRVVFMVNDYDDSSDDVEIEPLSVQIILPHELIEKHAPVAIETHIFYSDDDVYLSSESIIDCPHALIEEGYISGESINKDYNLWLALDPSVAQVEHITKNYYVIVFDGPLAQILVFLC